MKDKNKGVEIICGTTGSGRCLTISQLEKEYNFKKEDRKVIIINDPVEYEIKQPKINIVKDN